MTKQTGRPPLVIVTPMPPQRNGIADYAAELLPGLHRHFRCVTVVANGTRAGLPPQRDILEMRQYQAASPRLREAPHLYHIGNNPDHAYLLPLLEERPGTVVLHDTVLHDLMVAATIGTGRPEAFLSALSEEFGWPGRVLAAQSLRYQVREEDMGQRLPMITGVLRQARRVIVHSRFAAAQACLHGAGGRIDVIPHHIVPPPPEALAAGERLRYRLGLPKRGLLITFLGLITPAKQVELALHAVAEVAGELQPFRVILAGEVSPACHDLHALVTSLDLVGSVQLAGHWPPDELPALLAATDILVSLRFPTAGETSGSLMRALGAGVCAIVNGAGAFLELPASVVCRLPGGPVSRDRLAGVLRDLAAAPAKRRAFAAAARRWATSRSLAASTDAYRDAIHRATIGKSVAPVHVGTWLFNPVVPITPTLPALPIWYAALLLPRNVPAARIQAVFASTEEEVLLRPAHGQVLDGPTWDWADILSAGPFPMRDLLLLSQPARHVAGALTTILSQAAQLLTLGGLFILELEEADMLPETQRLTQLLPWFGFECRQELGAPPARIEGGPYLPQTRRAWLAAKVSGFMARQYPGESLVKSLLGTAHSLAR